MLDIRVVGRVARVLQSRAFIALTTSVAVHAALIALLVTVVTFVRPAKQEPSLVIDLRSWVRAEAPVPAASAPAALPVRHPRISQAARTARPASAHRDRARPAPVSPAPPAVTAPEPAPPPPPEENRVEAVAPVGDATVTPDPTATPEPTATSGPVADAPQTSESAEARATEAAAERPAQPTPPAPDARVAAQMPEPAAPEIAPPDVRALEQKASVTAHAEGEPFRTRRDVLEYLLDHPEFATHLTRMLRIARYRVWETSDGLFLDDGWGATLKFSVNACEGGLRVIHASGHYDPGLLPNIRGELVVLLAPTFTSEPDGTAVVSLAVTTFVRFKSPVVDMVAKIARAAVEHKAQREARTLARVIARLSRAIEEDPAGLYHRLSERPEVPRRELREFAVLLGLP